MARVSNLLSWFFFCLAGALITVAMLAVPENAFADAGGDWCSANCLLETSDPMSYTSCYNACYTGYLNCADCSQYSGDEYTWCKEGCGAAGAPDCPTNNTCKTSCNRGGCVQTSSNPMKCVQPGRLGCNDGDCAKCQCDYRKKCDVEDNSCICW